MSLRSKRWRWNYRKKGIVFLFFFFSPFSSSVLVMWEHVCLHAQLLPPPLVPISLTHMSQGQFVLGPQLSCKSLQAL